MAVIWDLLQQVKELVLVEGAVVIGVEEVEHVARLVEAVGVTRQLVVIPDEFVEVDAAAPVCVRFRKLGRHLRRVARPRREALPEQSGELLGGEHPILVVVEVVEHPADLLEVLVVLLHCRLRGVCGHALLLAAAAAAGGLGAEAILPVWKELLAPCHVRSEGHLAVLLAAVGAVLPVGQRCRPCKALLFSQLVLGLHLRPHPAALLVDAQGRGAELLAAVAAILEVERHGCRARSSEQP